MEAWKGLFFIAFISLTPCYGTELSSKEPESQPVQYLTAAKNGDATAQYLVGLEYLDGLQKDEAEAIKWLRKAATNGPGNPGAQFMLGECYLLGVCGLNKNLKEGLNWTKRAAEQNDTDAQVCMGQLYTKQKPINWDAPDFKDLNEKDREEIRTGNYVGIEEIIDQDDATAIDWFRKAIKNGNVNARTQLASAYEDGAGVPEDYVEAYKWYVLAAAQGDVVGRILRDSLNKKLTRSQVAEAQKRASKWMKDNPRIWEKGQADARNVSKALKGTRKPTDTSTRNQ